MAWIQLEFEGLDLNIVEEGKVGKLIEKPHHYHITLLYGVLDTKIEEVMRYIKKKKHLILGEITLGGVKWGDYDTNVLMVEARSPHLQELFWRMYNKFQNNHRLIKGMYDPHITLGKVEQGSQKVLEEQSKRFLEGKKVRVSDVFAFDSGESMCDKINIVRLTKEEHEARKAKEQQELNEMAKSGKIDIFKLMEADQSRKFPSIWNKIEKSVKEEQKLFGAEEIDMDAVKYIAKHIADGTMEHISMARYSYLTGRNWSVRQMNFKAFANYGKEWKTDKITNASPEFTKLLCNETRALGFGVSVEDDKQTFSEGDRIALRINNHRYQNKWVSLTVTWPLTKEQEKQDEETEEESLKFLNLNTALQNPTFKCKIVTQ